MTSEKTLSTLQGTQKKLKLAAGHLLVKSFFDFFFAMVGVQ